MNLPGQHVVDKINAWIWQTNAESLSKIKQMGVQTSRLLFVITRDMSSGELSLRAMSMVYTTLLSIVPLLAVSFSVLKAFGVQHQIEPLLLEFLAPLGEKGADIGSNIIDFVNNVNVGVLGSLGLALLFYTVISLISKTEAAFNHIWRIHNIRNFMQRFSYYLSVLLIGPVLIFSGLGLTATMMNTSVVQSLVSMEPFGTLFYMGGLIAPYFLTIAAFIFVYIFLPNTKVKIIPAFAGAVTAALLWKSAGWVFASFIATSTKYHAIYSSFAILIFFMIWLYVSWLIFLIGAQIAFYVQEPTMVTRYRSSKTLGHAARETLALAIMYWIAKHFVENKGQWTQEALAARLAVPQDLVGELLEQLHDKKLIVATSENGVGFMPARDLDQISVYDILKATRDPMKNQQTQTTLFDYNETILRMDSQLNESLRDKFHMITLKQWINN